MMATTMIPPTAAAKPPSGELRFVAVRASLIPDEIISSRQLVAVRKQVVIGLVVVVVLLIGWFGLSWWQTKAANRDLDTTRHHGISLQAQQNQFGPLVQAQAEILNIQSQLQKLMVSDLSWKQLLATLRAQAPVDVTLTGVTGSVAAGGGVPGTLPGTSSTVLNTSGVAVIGTVTVNGTAPDKKTVAAYADKLAKLPGLSAPLVSSVEAGSRPVTFTINALITAGALGGRYKPITAVPATTGGH